MCIRANTYIHTCHVPLSLGKLRLERRKLVIEAGQRLVLLLSFRFYLLQLFDFALGPARTLMSETG